MNFTIIPGIRPNQAIIPCIFRGVGLLFPMSREKCTTGEDLPGERGNPDRVESTGLADLLAEGLVSRTLRKNSQEGVDENGATFKIAPSPFIHPRSLILRGPDEPGSHAA